ncbi:MAG: hypothetical protein J1E82_05810 [Muribaculaceae bacterium]|nr:hypothetical protein [Muribaculaceae bacterium]
MKSFLSFVIIIFCFYFFCSEGKSQKLIFSDHRQGIPSTAVLSDENEFYEIFINEESPASDWMDVAINSVWIYNKINGEATKFLTTVKPQYYGWYQSDDIKGLVYPIDSITAIDKIMAIDSTTMIVSGVPDLRNVYSYIINIPSKKATYLSCNAGVIGLTPEEGLIIAQSYRYVSDPDIAGRYTYLQIFDWEGNQVADLDLEKEHIKENHLGNYLDFKPKTKLILNSYNEDSDFKFPLEGTQNCWKYDYSFELFDPEDESIINTLIDKDPNWTKTSVGYHYFFVDNEYYLGIDINFDLKNKKITLIHGQAS